MHVDDENGVRQGGLIAFVRYYWHVLEPETKLVDTTVGRALARRMAKEFHDSDHEIEARTGANIPWIFDIEGEAGFRQREEHVIDVLTQRRHVVLATGGGAYMDPETRALLKEKATTVWLRADLDLIWKRVNRRDTRPLLKRDNPKQVLADLLAARGPIYAEADIVVDSGDGPASDAVQAIRDAMGFE